jgi:pyrroline-5-carboxylate reductase
MGNFPSEITDCLVLSLVAGVKLVQLDEYFGKTSLPIARVISNTAIAIRK